MATSPNNAVNQPNQVLTIFHLIKPNPNKTKPTPEKMRPKRIKQVTYWLVNKILSTNSLISEADLPAVCPTPQAPKL